MNEMQLQMEANAMAREVGQLVEQYRQNAPQPPNPATEMRQQEAAQHAQKLQRHTQNLWTEFNQTYRARCLQLLQAFDEQGFDTEQLQAQLQQGSDPRVLDQLTEALQSMAGKLDGA